KMDSIVEDAIDEAETGSPASVGSEESPHPTGEMTDQELESVLEDLKTEITVVGCGGAGSNTINRMFEEGIHGAKLVAANTDVQHLVDI
ncbi:hypothetical protein ACMYL3_24725, partial [Salmonella enterica subsp. enterica serovar Typhimurium]